MIGKVNRYAKVAASASLAIGAIVATAGPAAAASPNSGSGVDAAGLISAGPLAQSTFPGTSPNSLATINVAGLITTGLVNTTADATSASAQVANPAVTLSAVASLSGGDDELVHDAAGGVDVVVLREFAEHCDLFEWQGGVGVGQYGDRGGDLHRGRGAKACAEGDIAMNLKMEGRWCDTAQLKLAEYSDGVVAPVAAREMVW